MVINIHLLFSSSCQLVMNQFPLPLSAFSCPSGWKEFGGHCYLLVSIVMDWADAEKNCKSKGGHLASVHSAAENTFIHNLNPNHSPYLGGTDAAVEVGTHIHTLQIKGYLILLLLFNGYVYPNILNRYKWMISYSYLILSCILHRLSFTLFSLNITLT